MKAEPDYFPLIPGLRLDYITKNAEGSGLMRVEVLSVARRGGVLRGRCRRVTEWEGEVETEEYAVLKRSTGVYSGPEKEFPLPAAVGRKWRRYPNEYRVESLKAVTTVPAGTFRNCLRVGYLIAGGDAGGGERYYAPGVGFVRELRSDESDPYEFLLKCARIP